MFVASTQLVEQFKRLIHDPFGTCTWTIHLIHHNDRLQAQRQRLAGNETRLRHWAVNRIDQQQHAIDHRQHSLHFTAKIRMAWGIDDIDVSAVVLNRAVFGQNRDAALFFQVIGIHDAGIDLLVFAEGAGLTQQLIDERGFAVINVGDNGDVADGAFCV